MSRIPRRQGYTGPDEVEIGGTLFNIIYNQEKKNVQNTYVDKL